MTISKQSTVTGFVTKTKVPYLTQGDIVDTEITIGLSLLSIQQLLDGDRAQCVVCLFLFSWKVKGYKT